MLARETTISQNDQLPSSVGSLLEFKKKYLTSSEMEFLLNNPLPKNIEAKFRAFVNLSIDAALPLVVKKKEADE